MAVQSNTLLRMGLLLMFLVAGSVSLAQEEGADLGAMLADLEQASEELPPDDPVMVEVEGRR